MQDQNQNQTDDNDTKKPADKDDVVVKATSGDDAAPADVSAKSSGAPER